VFATALELIDRDGADALSMRRLGAALDRDPMILYRHAPGKAALLDGVVETVLAQLKVDPSDPDWTAQLRGVARDYRALALAHPNVVPLLVTRPAGGDLPLTFWQLRGWRVWQPASVLFSGGCRRPG
jgi:AcrR family transcriptional regulator